MNIEFVKETNEWFGLCRNTVWNGLMYDELLYCEIIPIGYNTYQVRWEDNWNNPVIKNTLEEAEEYVRKEFIKHIPFLNSVGYEIE